VDIEPSAVDIAKLRFWLSLVVDEDLEPTFLEQRYANATQRDPHPLPNLDYNIMCGDSLVDEFEGIKLFDDNIFLDTDKKDVQQQLFKNTTHSLLDDLFKLQEKFYNESDLNKKMKLKETIDNDIDKIIRTKLEQDGDDAALQKYEKSLKTKVKPYFLWKLEFGKVFKEKGGFDIVLGNPPYLKEGRVLKEVFDGIRETIYYQGKMDLWYAFAWKGIDLLTDTGHLCFIATNNWTTNTGASKLRNKVIVDTRIVQLIDFGNVMIFESASIQTMVMLFQKNKRADNYSFDYRKLQGDTTLSDAVSLLQKRQNAKAEYLSPNIVRENLMDSFLVFSKSESLFEKIAFEKEFLKEKEVANGIHPHYDFVNNKIAARHNFMVGEGIFGLTEQEKQNLHLSEKELELIKPYYTTEQIHRYYSDSANTLWLIYTNSSFKNPRSMDNNPILKRHLDRFADVITSDNKPYGLHRAREERFFNGEKLIALRKCVGRPSFSYSDFDCYVSATFYVIKTARFSMKYLLGLFNSRLMMFWLKNKGKMQGVNFQLDKEPLLGMPIQPISKNHEELFIVLVDQILVAKQNDPHADTSDLESQIDAIVFNLYGLTEEEIMTVLLSMPSVSESERRNIQAYYKELIANSKKPKV
jgi:adenine-specific DNA-methyltransferase